MIHRLAAGGAVLVGITLPVLPLAGLVGEVLAPQRRAFAGAGADLRAILVDSRVPELFVHTLALAAVVCVVAVTAGTWLAWVEQRGRYPGRRALGVAGLLPLGVPSYVLAGALRETLGPGGTIGRPLGLGMFTGFWPAALALTLVTIPYAQLLVGSALARLPAAEEEAARTLGAAGWRCFRAVLLPRLRPALAFACLLTALYVVSDFGAVAMLDCPVLTWRLYLAVNHYRFDQALVLGLGVLAATVPLLVAVRALHGRAGRTVARGGVANPRPPRRRRLGPLALALTYGLHGAVVGLGVVLPVATLAGWVLDGVAHGGALEGIGRPLVETLGVALIGGVATVLVAWTPAWVAARAGRRVSWWIEQATYLTSALPGVLLAFGLLLAALMVSRWWGGGSLYGFLTGSGVLLVVGYCVRFLAEAFAGLKTAFLRLDPRQDETARVLGARSFRRFARVALPAVAPGAAVALVLVVMAVVKELPVTLLLGGATGLRTLSFRVFDRYQDAFLADAGAAGLALVALALATVVLTLRWRRHV